MVGYIGFRVIGEIQAGFGVALGIMEKKWKLLCYNKIYIGVT